MRRSKYGDRKIKDFNPSSEDLVGPGRDLQSCVKKLFWAYIGSNSSHVASYKHLIWVEKAGEKRLFVRIYTGPSRGKSRWMSAESLIKVADDITCNYVEKETSCDSPALSYKLKDRQFTARCVRHGLK